MKNMQPENKKRNVNELTNAALLGVGAENVDLAPSTDLHH